jgi:hypothetical protein
MTRERESTGEAVRTGGVEVERRKSDGTGVEI